VYFSWIVHGESNIWWKGWIWSDAEIYFNLGDAFQFNDWKDVLQEKKKVFWWSGKEIFIQKCKEIWIFKMELENWKAKEFAWLFDSKTSFTWKFICPKGYREGFFVIVGFDQRNVDLWTKRKNFSIRGFTAWIFKKDLIKHLWKWNHSTVWNSKDPAFLPFSLHIGDEMKIPIFPCWLIPEMMEKPNFDFFFPL
jgi:hypothetical protein